MITDASGNPVLRLAETTDGPEQLSDVTAADDAVATLLGAVMEKISVEIGKSTWTSEHPAVTAAAATPSTSAAPVAPQEDTIPPSDTVE